MGHHITCDSIGIDTPYKRLRECTTSFKRTADMNTTCDSFGP